MTEEYQNAESETERAAQCVEQAVRLVLSTREASNPENRVTLESIEML